MNTKNQEFLEEFNKAFARSNSDYIIKHVTDDVKWTVLGDFSVEGKEAFITELKKMESPEPFELAIKNIIARDQLAAVEGTMKSPNGKTYAFCDVYHFQDLENPMIKELTSYVFEV